MRVRTSFHDGMTRLLFPHNSGTFFSRFSHSLGTTSYHFLTLTSTSFPHLLTLTHKNVVIFLPSQAVSTRLHVQARLLDAWTLLLLLLLLLIVPFLPSFESSHLQLSQFRSKSDKVLLVPTSLILSTNLYALLHPVMQEHWSSRKTVRCLSLSQEFVSVVPHFPCSVVNIVLSLRSPLHQLPDGSINAPNNELIFDLNPWSGDFDKKQNRKGWSPDSVSFSRRAKESKRVFKIDAASNSNTETSSRLNPTSKSTARPEQSYLHVTSFEPFVIHQSKRLSSPGE